MKYLRHFGIVLGKSIFKASVYFSVLALLIWSYGLMITSLIFIAWITVGYLTRRYNTNVVFNYCLQNNVHLPRLNEIGWYYDKETDCYLNKIEPKGYIKYRKISKIEFVFAFLLWLWVDSDSENDTTDQDVIMDRVISREIYKWFPNFIVSIVKKEKEKAVKKLESMINEGIKNLKLYDRIIQSLAIMYYDINNLKKSLELLLQIEDDILTSNSVKFKITGLYYLSRNYRSKKNYSKSSRSRSRRKTGISSGRSSE